MRRRRKGTRNMKTEMRSQLTERLNLESMNILVSRAKTNRTTRLL